VTLSRCPHCQTELPPFPLACPACGLLIHADRLKQLAAAAESFTQSGNLAAARDQWMQTLQLLPPQSHQHKLIRDRITDLARRIEATNTDSPAQSADERSWWQRGAGGAITVGFLLLSKLKFLLIGLTKASTFISMFAFFGVYWSAYGWPLALGLVLSIYIHEMGHVAMLRRLGIDAGAPMFIPGVGAVVMLKQHVQDPLTDAKIGLAGPVWGLGAAIVALAVYGGTGAKIWLAIAQLTGFMNLFNLIPVWQLDGSRGFQVLARSERWMVVATIAVALMMTEQRLLLIIGAFAVWRAMQKEHGPGDTRVLATFATLVLTLSLLARGLG
jgi:Zn-dependent protease